MKKLLLIAILMLGVSVSAQELSVNGGWGQAMEHIGSDIKDGGTFSFNFRGDVFKKNNFNFGPSISVYHLGDLTTDIESVKSETNLSGGLFTGFDAGRFSVESGVELIVPNQHESEDIFFTSILANSVKYQFKDSNFGVKLNYDYFFNKNLFHYTYNVGAGVFLKF